MFKQIILFLAVAIPIMVMCYDEKYDKIDVDKTLADEKLFNGYLDCLLDKGPCDVEYSKDFKELLPEVIATACEKCTPLQKANVRKSIKALQQKRPQEFDIFRQKYDPDHKYEKKFMSFLLEQDK